MVERSEREVLEDAYSDAHKALRAPVQGYGAGIPWPIHLEAYDAYCARWGKQTALINLKDRYCRGGFSTGELDQLVPGWRERVSEMTALRERVAALEAMINSPEIDSFERGVRLEAVHQRERWGSDHDAGKAPEDWFWLLGYLGGKALRAALIGDSEKARHHTISSAAALANWHLALSGADNRMRPGIDPAEKGIAA